MLRRKRRQENLGWVEFLRVQDLRPPLPVYPLDSQGSRQGLEWRTGSKLLHLWGTSKRLVYCAEPLPGEFGGTATLKIHVLQIMHSHDHLISSKYA